MKSSTSGAREGKRAALATFGMKRGQGGKALVERRDLANNGHLKTGSASQKTHLRIQLCFVGATFQGLENAWQTTHKEEGLRRFYKNVDEAHGESHLA